MHTIEETKLQERIANVKKVAIDAKKSVVIIEVMGGVAYVNENSDDVIVEIIDHDSEEE